MTHISEHNEFGDFASKIDDVGNCCPLGCRYVIIY